MNKSPDDIEKLEKRIAEFDSKNGAIKDNHHLTSNRLFAKSFVLGTEFVGAIVVGVGLGVLLDRLFGCKILFTIVFALFGCIAGVMNMYRSAKDIEKDIE